MKLNDFLNDSTKKALEHLASQPMEPVVAIKFARFVREVFLAIRDFETKKAELFEKYGERIEAVEGPALKILPENQKKFDAAIKRALNKKIDLKPFDLSQSGCFFSPTDLINVTELFK